MSVCARCGAVFGCAMADGGDGQPCWCTALPAVVPVPAPDLARGGNPAGQAGAACWCPACLRRHIADATPPASPPPTP